MLHYSPLLQTLQRLEVPCFQIICHYTTCLDTLQRLEVPCF